MGRELRGIRRGRKRKGLVGKTGMALLMASAALTPAVVINADVAEASSPFAGGLGTVSSPYIIETPEELNQIRNYTSNHFTIKNDIDLEGLAWQPIPTFTGVLDGGGYSIKGLTINTSEDNTGFIGLLKGTVQDVTFVGAEVETNRNQTGVLAGESEGSTIRDVGVEGGSVKGYVNTGGLVGFSKESVITNVYMSGNVEGGNTTGGLVGRTAISTKIKNAYVTGRVKGRSGTGGLVGNLSSGATIENAYTTGDVKGTNYTGGLVGEIVGTEATASKVYATGSVEGDTYVGGVIGSSGGKVENVYALNKEVSGTGSNIGKAIGRGVGTNIQAYTDMLGIGHDKNINTHLGVDKLVEKSTYTFSGFEFGDTGETPIWGIKEEKSLPYLHFNPMTTVYNPDTGKWETTEGFGGDTDGEGENGGTGSEGGGEGTGTEGDGEGSEGDGDGSGSEGDNNSGNTSSTATQDVQVEIGAGELWLDAPNIKKFGKVMLGDKKETVSTTFDDIFKVTDARGTGEGWRLSVSASQFKEVEPEGGFKEGTGNYTLPKGSLTLSSSAAVTQIGSDDGVLPTVGTSVDTVIDGGGSVLVASAGINEGMGTYGLEYGEGALSLVIDPSTVKLDGENYGSDPTPYESTLTWELVSGL